MSCAESPKDFLIQLYTSQLSDIITPIIFTGFQSLFDEAIRFSPNNGIKEFQTFLRNIPNWQPKLLDTEVERIRFESKLNDYLNQLFDIIMFTTIMIMSGTPQNKKHRIETPSDITFEKFIHTTYINAAEKIFTNPYLFNPESDETTASKNRQEIMNYINNAISLALVKMTPIKYILDKYQGPDTEIIMSEHKKLMSEKHNNSIMAYGGGVNTHSVNDTMNHTNVKMSAQQSYILTPQNTPQNTSQNIPQNVINHSDANTVLSQHISNIGIQEKKREEEIKINENSFQQSYPSKHSESDKRVKKSNKQNNSGNKLINLNEIPQTPQTPDPNESEAYYKIQKPPADVFSNKKYVKEISDVNTTEIKRYAMGHPAKGKQISTHTTDNNSSVRNFVPPKKITNTKL